jgi:hypothetical protein
MGWTQPLHALQHVHVELQAGSLPAWQQALRKCFSTERQGVR